MMFCLKFQNKLNLSTIILANSRRQLARKIIQPNVIRVIRPNQSNEQQQQPLRRSTKIPQLPKHFDEGFQYREDDNDNNGHEDEKFSKNEKRSSESSKNLNIPKYQKNDHVKDKFSELIIQMKLKKKKFENLILLEGKRLINDAIDKNIKFQYIFFSSKDYLEDVKNLNDLIEYHRVSLIKVPYNEMKIYSSLTTPPGLMAIVEKPDNTNFESQPMDLPLTLICDNVRDPGNMGTIIRTSAAAGIQKIILTEGCVDPWSQKVIKSAAGAHFNIPIYTKFNWENLPEQLPDCFDLYLADSKYVNNNNNNDNDIKSSLYYEMDFFSQKNPKILIIGNEGYGLSSKCYQFAQKNFGQRLKIPSFGNMESLNSAIATAILLYEFRRQFEFLEENDKNKIKMS